MLSDINKDSVFQLCRHNPINVLSILTAEIFILRMAVPIFIVRKRTDA